ncbi:hypothetical protein [Achromobacter sp.]|uniref:hypothetical protein n=1 Tax=Achromobacter sp. TaxID=134375 RepID=UPI0028B0B377|nr:hypothetical protein [Achromobacter sp.]
MTPHSKKVGEFLASRKRGHGRRQVIAPFLPELGGKFGFTLDLSVFQRPRHGNRPLFAQGGA